MLISHRHKFVILSPWKTASSTMWARLNTYSEGAYNRFFEFNPYLHRVVTQHLTYADFAALPEAQLGYRVVAFVRNPYDRCYSGFRQLQKDLLNQPVAEYSSPWVKRVVMRQLAANFESLALSDFDFNRWLSLVDDSLILNAGQNTNFPLHPAHYWTHSGGEQRVGFIGRVEHFEEDFSAMCDWLGIETPPSIYNDNVDNEAAVQSRQDLRYIDHIDDHSIARINRLFRGDFDLLGYERVLTRRGVAST